MDISEIDVFVGVDVGKSEHWANAQSRTGKVLYDRCLPNDEEKLRCLLEDLQRHGYVLLVVDQPATIGALVVALAQSMGHLGGLSAGTVHETDRGPHPGQREDRSQGCSGHC